MPCSITVKSLRLDLTFRLTRQPGTISRMLAEDTRLLGQRQRTSVLLTQQEACVPVHTSPFRPSSPMRVMYVAPVDAVYSVCMTVRKGVKKTTKDADTCPVRELQDLGPPPTVSDKLFCKLKGDSDQIVIRATRRGVIDSAFSSIKVFATV